MNETIPLDYLTIPVGGHFKVSWWSVDSTTGEPPDWTDWTGKMQVRDGPSGTLLLTCSTSPGSAGSITLGDAGNITAEVPDTFTVTLVPTVMATFDLELTDPDDKVWRVVEGRVRISQEVTTDA